MFTYLSIQQKRFGVMCTIVSAWQSRCDGVRFLVHSSRNNRDICMTTSNDYKSGNESNRKQFHLNRQPLIMVHMATKTSPEYSTKRIFCMVK